MAEWEESCSMNGKKTENILCGLEANLVAYQVSFNRQLFLYKIDSVFKKLLFYLMLLC